MVTDQIHYKPLYYFAVIGLVFAISIVAAVAIDVTVAAAANVCGYNCFCPLALLVSFIAANLNVVSGFGQYHHSYPNLFGCTMFQQFYFFFFLCKNLNTLIFIYFKKVITCHYIHLLYIRLSYKDIVLMVCFFFIFLCKIKLTIYFNILIKLK